MFELATQKAGKVLQTTRMIARRVYKDVRKEEREQHLEHAKQEMEKAKEGEGTGMVDVVDAHILAALKETKLEENLDMKIERMVVIFMYRVLKGYRTEEQEYEEIRQKLLQVFSGSDPLDDKSRDHVEIIINFFQKEQARIHDELLRFARIMKDQDFQHVRMRDEIILGVMKDMQEKIKARGLRREWSHEHHEEKIIVQDLRVIGKGIKDTNPDKKKLAAALANLEDHLKKENNVLEQIMQNIEFILKMAVMFVFKMMKAENKEAFLINHLKEMKYPDSHWEILNKKKEGVEKSIVDDLRGVMHEMYQFLHSNEGAKKAT